MCVWSLYARSALLYSSCFAVRVNPLIPDADKEEFALRAWIETETIEAALNLHKCGIEKAMSEWNSEVRLYLPSGIDHGRTAQCIMAEGIYSSA